MFKTIIVLLSLVTVLTLSIYKTISKLSPSLLDNTLSYCKSIVGNNLTIPHGFERLPIITLSILMIVIALTISINLIKIKLLKNRLHKKTLTNRKIEKILNKEALNKKAYLINDNIAFAFCIGIINPKIYISSGMLKITNQKELKAVLIHEKHHLTNKDPLIAFLFSVAKPFLLVFPLLSDIEHNYRIEREIEADKKVYKKLNNIKPLVSVLEKLLALPRQNIKYVTALANSKTLEPRINALINKKYKYRKYKTRNIIISIFMFTILLTLTALPTKAIEDHSGKTDSVQFCFTDNVDITPNIINKLHSSNLPKFSSVKININD